MPLIRNILPYAVLLSACCPTIVGQPGDASSIDWAPPEKLEGSSVIDCGGKKRGRLDVVTSNVTIRNCLIEGDVRIWGLARNASSSNLQELSRRQDYVSIVRAVAPAHTTIENCTINGIGTIPLYIGPGSTFTTINSVTVSGISEGTMIYIDAESHKTTIVSSTIDATGANREAIAIDASDHNILRNNTIMHKNGGIYLYRNCGEGGVIRHTTPSYNTIEDNGIYGDGVSIWIGSREGSRCYCEADKGWPFGSSASDMDHARFNVVQHNALGGGAINVGNYSISNTVENNDR